MSFVNRNNAKISNRPSGGGSKLQGLAPKATPYFKAPYTGRQYSTDTGDGSNRNVVFELPLIASAKTSNYITQLPKSVNELRSRSMMKWTKADGADLRSVIIRTAEPLAEPVIVSRIPGEPYQLITPNNTKTEIDEAVFGELLKELASTPVKNFASDAATDFSPYGIDKPMVILDFISFESKDY